MNLFSRPITALLFFLWASTAYAIDETPRPLPGASVVQDGVRVLVEELRGAPGVVVGLRDANGRRVYAHGKTRRWGGEQVRPDARFDIGSITKGFNGLLLAEMAGRGEVRLDQPIGELVPPDVDLAPEIAAITLEDLATHHSGLPALPASERLRPMRSSYQGSTVEGLFEDLAGQSPERVAEQRGQFAYSNFGVAVLGQLLARRAGQSWDTLLRERVLEPLGIDDAGFLIGTRPEDGVQGHYRGRAVGGWIMDAYAPAGGLVMDVEGLLDLGEHLLAGGPAFVSEAVRSRRAVGDSGDRATGLGWVHSTVAGHRLIWHNGAVSGARSFLGVVPEQGWVVVVLANGDADVDALAAHILDPERPLEAPPWRWARVVLTLLAVFALPMASLLGLRKLGDAKTDRVRVLEWIAGAALVFIVLRNEGSWTSLPFVLWWVACTVTLAVGAVIAWKARRLPWLVPGRWRFARCAWVVVLSLAVLFQLLLVVMVHP